MDSIVESSVEKSYFHQKVHVLNLHLTSHNQFPQLNYCVNSEIHLNNSRFRPCVTYYIVMTTKRVRFIVITYI